MFCRLIVSVVCTLFCAVGLAAEKPNVLFLAVDDMNDWIGCLESVPQAITPNLNRLAARGVNFTNAHTAGVFCAPSRAAIFSGQFASTTGCYRNPCYFVDHPEIEPLQLSFAKAGYQTFGAGKLYHHGAGAIDTRGWTEFFFRNDWQRQAGWSLDSWAEDTPVPQPFPNSVYNRGAEISGGLFLEWGAVPDGGEKAMADTARMNWAVKKLTEKHDAPFFLGVGLYAPHYPNYCPQKFFDLYDRDAIELPPIKTDDLDDLPPKIKKMKTARSRIPRRLEELGAMKDAMHGYLACISYADAMLGRVLDALEASPYAENTIVVMWSDHGYHLGEKGDWGKHTLWERTSNVPFLWAGPGVAKGVQSDITVSLIDMYPTLVGMCGLPKPEQHLEGTSLAATLANPTTAHDRDVFLPHMNPGEFAVMNRDWRYIRYGDDGEELYDVQADPNEWHNLAANPVFKSKKEKLRSAAPDTFAEPIKDLNARKSLVIEGDTFRWKRGEGNYVPRSKNRPYADSSDSKTSKPAKKKSSQKNHSVRKRPNILFVVCDDLNTHVSPSGYDAIQTPTLAGLAAESMTFRNAYCQYPVCGPSRASFLTGRYPETTGVLNNTTDLRDACPDAVTMPEFFKEHGYWTASTGKVFHSTRHELGELAWNEHVRFKNDELSVVRAAREAFEAEYGSVDDSKNRRKWKGLQKQVSAKLNAQTPPGHGRSGLDDSQHKDGKNVRQVASWLSNHSHGEKPFFIACGIQKPHVPFLAPDKYFELYPSEKLPLLSYPSNLWDTLPKTAISKRYEAFGFELGKENPGLRREYMQSYHACISFLDAQLKIVFDALKSSGHWEDTVVIFTSDHGYHLGEHFLWGKVTLFDIGTRVPFLVRVPGLTKGGTESEAMVELVDIYPTLVDVAGLEPPAGLQGVSLRPLLNHPERRGKKKVAYTVVTRGSKLGYAVRNQNWRYSKWPDGEELYNLNNDPEEKKNLVSFPHVAERVAEFRAFLAGKQEQAAGTIRSKAP